MALSPDHLAALIDVRLAELRELAAETAYAYGREQCFAATRRLLKPLRARSPEQAWRAEVRRQVRRLEAAYRRRLRG